MPKLLPPRNLRTGLKKTPLDETIDPGVGWFGYMEWDDGDWLPIIQWTHCRDIFQDVSNTSISLKGMWFCHVLGAAESICAFIDRVESKLNLNERSLFRKTPYPNILWIKPSPFWIHDFVRRSFFTLCLRCGMRYKRMKDNFDYAMFRHYKIAKQTVPAIKRFLQGYTFYPYEDPEFNTMGWNFLFSNINGPELEKLLVRG